MNDRELLELAAKAAGIDPVLANPIEFSTGTEYYWNPLTDDGDALRLAVAMGMEVYHADDDGIAAYASYPSRRGHSYAIEQHGDDSLAATRRAIVRAAAAIGEAMPDGYVLVPVDPTPEMLDRYPFNVSAVTSEPMDKEDLRVVYQAMLATAPSAQQKESDDE